MSPAPRQKHGYGLREDQEVASKRPVTHVLKFEVNSVRIPNSAAAVHLPSSCHSGLERKEHRRPVPILPELIRHYRPRANKRHVAFKNIDELRKLIQARFAQQPTDPRQPRILVLAELKI